MTIIVYLSKLRAPGQGRRLGGATPGAEAEQAQEGLEELSQVEGQEGRR